VSFGTTARPERLALAKLAAEFPLHDGMEGFYRSEAVYRSGDGLNASRNEPSRGGYPRN